MKIAREPNKKVIARTIGLCLLCCLVGSGAWALDSFFVGARGQAMAGSNTASVDDGSAQYYNPAAYGFFSYKDDNGERFGCDNNDLARKDWGLRLSTGMGIRMLGRIPDYLETLSGVDMDAFSDGIDTTDPTGEAGKKDLQNLIRITSALGGIDDEGNVMMVDFNIAAALTVKHFGIGMRGYFESVAWVEELDSTNLGLDVTPAQVSNDIVSEAQTANYGPTAGAELNNYVIKNFNGAQVGKLSAAGLSADAIKYLDFAAGQLDLPPEDIDNAANLLEDVVNESGTGAGTSDIGQNKTRVSLRAFGLAEVPISYGVPLSKHWSIGGNLKIMQGTVYANEVEVFDEDAEDAMAEAKDYSEDTINFGVDLGLMGRFKCFNFGVVGRNLNSPSFDGPENAPSGGSGPGTNNSDVTLDPQVQAGVAFIPFKTLVLEANVDLVTNKTIYDGYETKYLRAGAEWDILRFLALRGGAYTNLEDDETGPVITAGLGVNFWLVRLDAGLAVSTDTITLEETGDEVPKEIRGTVAASMDF